MPIWEIIAKGRVQGVGFRWYVHDCALRCGIRGFVKNLMDGSVQIIADTSGSDESSPLGFCELIQNGHRLAVVTELEITELVSAKEYNDFTIR